MPRSSVKPLMPALSGLGGKCCSWHSGIPGLQGAVWFMSHSCQLSLLPGYLCQPWDPLTGHDQWEGGCGWLQVGTGAGTHGDAHSGQDVQAPSHTPQHTQVCTHGEGTVVHRHACTPTHMAHTGLGKYPPHTMCPCANPTREVTVNANK